MSIRRLFVSSIAMSAVVTGAIAMSAALSGSALAADLKSVSPKFLAPGAIEKSLSEKSMARVIVTVEPTGGMAAAKAEIGRPEGRAAAKARIRASIDEAIARHFGGRAQSLNGSQIVRLSTSPSFSAELTRDQLMSLVRDPSVVSITIDEAATTQLDTSTATIGMPAARAGGATGVARTAVVIDTGVQTDHPFLGTTRVRAEGCFLITTNCPNGTNEQTGTGSGRPHSYLNSHGTHVAGIVLGKQTVSGATPSMGVAYRSSLIAINVFESSGYTYDSSMIRALEYVEDLAIANPSWYIRSVNMSIGGGAYSDYCDATRASFKAVIDRLRDLRISVVVAAGNDSYTSQISSPACISSVESVASTNRAGTAVAYYSNIDARTRVFAPGGDSTNGGAVVSRIMNSQYAAYQGTSMATPHVAGAIAALATKYPSRQISVLEDALHRTGIPVTDTRVGGGVTLPRIDVAAALTFLAAPPAPANDNFAAAQALSVGSGAWGSTTGATAQSGEPVYTGSAGASIWYKITSPTTQRIRIRTLGSNFDTRLCVYTGTAVEALTKVAYNDDASTTEKSSEVTFNATAGTTYWIGVGPRKSGYTGTVRIETVGVPMNDIFRYATAVNVPTTVKTSVTGSNVNATLETGEPSAHGTASVWWRFKARESATYTVDTIGSVNTNGASMDTMLAVYTGTAVNALTLKASNDDNPSGGVTSKLTFATVADTTYYVAVGGYPTASYRTGSISLNITPPGAPASVAAVSAGAPPATK